MNSSYNVGEPQLRMLRDEFARGDELAQRAEAGATPWAELFAPSDFFWRWRHYVRVDVIAAGAGEPPGAEAAHGARARGGGGGGGRRPACGRDKLLISC